MKRAIHFLLSLIIMIFAISLIQQDKAFSSSLRDTMIAQAKKEKQLVIGGGNADETRDELVNFRKMYPFIAMKAIVANTASTINRIVAESRAGRMSTDLVSVGTDALEMLTEEKLLQKMEFPHLKDFPAETQPHHGYYVQAFYNPRVQGAYNTDLVPPNEVPRSWEDMVDPKWKDKTMISSTVDELPARLAWLWRGKDGKWDWERSFDFFRKLEKHKPLLASGMRGGINRLAAGETAIFWFPAIGAPARLHFSGAPVGLFAFPKIIGPFRSFGISKGAPNPASAWLYLDYLTSPQGQYDYTELVAATLPANKKAKPGKLARWVMSQGGTLENIVPLSYADLVHSKADAKKSADFFFEIMGIR
ncbi:MAG: extracellular solute-binding protein [Desulfobacterales bacterium]|nr:extracellular solute-binding protein [Desulfobacterales bacterium]